MVINISRFEYIGVIPISRECNSFRLLYKCEAQCSAMARGSSSDLRALSVDVLATFATLHALLAGVGVFLVGVQVDALGEALEADEAEVRLLPAVDQLVSLQI